MKVVKIICLSILVSLAAVSCKEASKDANKVVKTTNTENLKKIEVGIEGMTCEIGCAKTIESKLSKTEGISSVAISFEDKLGKIVYDESVISKEEISKKIEAIAGGETYKVVSLKDAKHACCAADLKSCTMKCSKECTKENCDKCAEKQTACLEKCATKKNMACCSADLKTCTMKCSKECTKADCDKCAAKQEECKKKCAVEKQACCKSDKKSCAVKCSKDCTKADCDKCEKATADCKAKCAAKA